MMKLYYSPGACSLASHIALEETGLPFERHKVDFAGGEGEMPEFRKLSPLGVVPVLVINNDNDNGEALTEGSAILQYIADRKPELGLAPRPGTPERYRLQEALNFIATEVHKSFSSLYALGAISGEASVQEAVRAHALSTLGARFDIVESRLASQDYALSSGFSVADPYLFVVLRWTTHLKIELSRWPRIKNYLQRIGARDAVQRALKAEGLF